MTRMGEKVLSLVLGQGAADLLRTAEGLQPGEGRDIWALQGGAGAWWIVLFLDLQPRGTPSLNTWMVGSLIRPLLASTACR